MIEYPEDLPFPQRSGYGFTPVSPLLRSELQSGRARQRRRFTSTPTVGSFTWLLSDTQAVLFEAWFKEVLLDGSQWFECPLKAPMGKKAYVARFMDIYSGPVLFGRSHWQYSANLELRERPVLTGGWAIYAPQFVAHMNLVDLAVNREWPEA
ncbi:hypothetical protein [Pseudomonas citronellolis]|uniref:hypothetical protein n=1 Tax=Pseudomonas citronellolis TaxID=53408 RepID=UPI002D77A30A|nr:hypothetical protein [Pseudomonas citronellolis]WRT83460.1 hypothetical protein VK748_03270 [Pseudomonas citronellolis]